MNLVSRRDLTQVVRDRYWRASKKEKIKILDEFVENTGYHRKYALALLHNRVPRRTGTGRRRKRVYTPEVVDALTFIWTKMRYCGSHRLHPFMPEMISALEHHDELHVLPTTRQLPVQMCPATIDRLLKPARTLGVPRTTVYEYIMPDAYALIVDELQRYC